MTGEDFYEQTTRPKREILDRLREEIVRQPKQSDEFTVMEAADQFDLDYKTAQYRIKKLERQGKVTSRKPGNKRYYRFVT